MAKATSAPKPTTQPKLVTLSCHHAGCAETIDIEPNASFVLLVHEAGWRYIDSATGQVYMVCPAHAQKGANVWP